MLCFVTGLRCDPDGRTSTLALPTEASEAAGRKTRCKQIPHAAWRADGGLSPR